MHICDFYNPFTTGYALRTPAAMPKDREGKLTKLIIGHAQLVQT